MKHPGCRLGGCKYVHWRHSSVETPFLTQSRALLNQPGPPGTGLGTATGLGLGLGLGTGLGMGLGMGLGTGLGTGLAVGLGVGMGLAAGLEGEGEGRSTATVQRSGGPDSFMRQLTQSSGAMVLAQVEQERA